MSPSVSEERSLGATVDEHVHRSVRTKIRLNKSTGKFGAFLGDAVITAGSLPEIKKILEKEIDEGLDLEWLPLIEVQVKPPGSDDSEFDEEDTNDSFNREVSLRVKRFYVARVQGPNWRQLEWGALKKGSSIERQLRDSKGWTPPIGDRETYHYDNAKQRLETARQEKAKETWKPPYYEDWNDQRYTVDAVLAYKPALWAALCQIAKLLDDAKKHLAHLTATDEGVKRISVAGANLPRLLGSGE